jgi:GntR family transcriptional regulator/MocR family aminotransferase
VVLSPTRRHQLLAWARDRDGVILEDDYDAEYRYDREPVGALQGLAPHRVVYLGTASKTLAPALRLGWVVAPDALWEAVARAKHFDDLGSGALEQLALADLIERGDLDRHLRRTRPRYRRRRDRLVAALQPLAPHVRVSGVAAGLHAVLELPSHVDEEALLRRAADRSLALYGLGRYRASALPGPPGLVLGYAGCPEHAFEEGLRALVEVLEHALDGSRYPPALG